MDRIFFENIRCFTNRQEVPLAPLTVLVGENSSGKSTFMALVRLAWDVATRAVTPDFNEEPFLLGAYEQIVSRKRGRLADRPFIVGLEHAIKVRNEPVPIKIIGQFGIRGGQPVLASWFLESAAYSLKAQFEGEKWLPLELDGPVGHEVFEQGLFGRATSSLAEVGALVMMMKQTRRKAEGTVVDSADVWGDALELGTRLFELSTSLGTRPYAFAPVRSRPQRTYDPIKGTEKPEGSHIPMILASGLLREPDRWKALFSSLGSFGRSSGLFNKVKVRRLGKSEGDPFQIQVHIGGNAVNLIDVGYGVSQVLPIVVDCLRGEEGGTFLLQQPEVHLHPKAQAELGSFLGVLAKQQKKRFVIETHSDHLVDRIRMDIRDDKGLKPEDVSLLYFERKNGEANIHRLTLDEHGNLLDPPPGYRSFFLEEELRFLGG